MDHPTASTRQQVVKVKVKPPNHIQARQWVQSWRAHFGVNATPGDLGNAINNRSLTSATQLKDQNRRKFHLGRNRLDLQETEIEDPRLGWLVIGNKGKWFKEVDTSTYRSSTT